MDAPRGPLTEARIREILAGMTAFHEKLRKRGRARDAQKPVPLPSAENYPPASSLADVVAPYFSDDPAEVAFYQDVMRLQELLTHVTMPGSARARINAAIASLRAQNVHVVGGVPDAAMLELFDVMFSSRIAQLQSITDEELSLVERFKPELEKELFHRAQSYIGGRPSRSGSRSTKRRGE
jgi:hypothetical protein